MRDNDRDVIFKRLYSNTPGNAKSSSILNATSSPAFTSSASSTMDSSTVNGRTDFVNNYTAMDFISDKIGWIYQASSELNAKSLDSAQLLKTTDGGKNWTSVWNSTSRFMKLDFVNEQTGWAIEQLDCNNDGTQCYIMKTTDGGQSWTRQFGFIWNNSFGPYQIKLFDENNGYFVENNKLLKTSDGGGNWADITPPTDTSANGIPHFYFLDVNTGWVTGSIQGAAVLYNTVDGGKHWAKIWSIKGNLFSGSTSGITFLNASTGWIILTTSDGVGAYLYRTTDGGRNFYQINTNSAISATRPVPMKMLLTGESTGWIATDHGAGPISAGLMYTSDAGKTFQSIFIGSANNSDCDDILFTSPNVGFSFSSVSIRSYVAGTTDGGKTWHLIR